MWLRLEAALRVSAQSFRLVQCRTTSSGRRSFFSDDRRFWNAVARRLTRYHALSTAAEEALQQGRMEAKWLRDEIRLRSEAPRVREQRRLALSWLARITRLDEPISYILGTQPFGPHELKVQAPILIPRPETEEWAMKVGRTIEKVAKARAPGSSFRMLDMCTGTGCVGLHLASCLASSGLDWQVTLCDKARTDTIDQLLQENRCRVAASSKVTDFVSRVHITYGDFFADKTIDDLKHASGRGYDLIVCNPPYITPDEYRSLPRSVRDWEDRGALVGVKSSGGLDDADQQGLAFYLRMAEVAPRLLSRPAGGAAPVLVMEIGHGQAKAVASILMRGFGSTADYRSEVWKDAFGADRVVAVYCTPDHRT